MYKGKCYETLCLFERRSLRKHTPSTRHVRVKYPRYRGLPVIAQNSRYNRFPPAANGWVTIHLIPDKAPPLQAEEEGQPIKKRTYPHSNPCLCFFHPTMGTGRQDFATCMTVLPPSTRGETQTSGQTRLGALSNG
jgi:hypothetical protein